MEALPFPVSFFARPILDLELNCCCFLLSNLYLDSRLQKSVVRLGLSIPVTFSSENFTKLTAHCILSSLLQTFSLPLPLLINLSQIILRGTKECVKLREIQPHASHQFSLSLNKNHPNIQKTFASKMGDDLVQNERFYMPN
jgi:hypothetical protein